jgi:ABC-type nitrate/sulfonate/bicarbonate transport system ATPase subunit
MSLTLQHSEEKFRRSVEISNLVKEYPNPYGEDFRVVENFNLNIQEGEFISLIGHSGCGKSTVLTMLAGLNEISDGGIIVGTKEIDGPGPDRAVVFQAPCLMPWMNAFQNVMLGVKNVYPHVSKSERKQIVEYSLSVVGLADAMKKYPREMSGACSSGSASHERSRSSQKSSSLMSLLDASIPSPEWSYKMSSLTYLLEKN